MARYILSIGDDAPFILYSVNKLITCSECKYYDTRYNEYTGDKVKKCVLTNTIPSPDFYCGLAEIRGDKEKK